MLKSSKPFWRLVSFIFLLVFMLCGNTFPELLLTVLSLCILSFGYGVSYRDSFLPLLKMWSFFLVVFLFNALFGLGDEVLFSWSFIRVTVQGIEAGISMVVRVVLASTLANILTLSMDPMMLSEAISTLISPLRIFHLPVDEAANITSLAFSFIPSLKKDADDVSKAMKARGVTGRCRMSRMVLPLSIASFRRADDLALAMESRGYDGHSRRRKINIRPNRCDMGLVAMSAALPVIGAFI